MLPIAEIRAKKSRRQIPGSRVGPAVTCRWESADRPESRRGLRHQNLRCSLRREGKVLRGIMGA